MTCREACAWRVWGSFEHHTQETPNTGLCELVSVSLSNCVFKLPCVCVHVCVHVSFHSGRGGQTCFLRLPRYHRVGGLEQRELIQSSGDQRPEIKAEVSLVVCGGSEAVSAACCSPCFSERPAAPRVPWLWGITLGSGPTSTGCSPRVSVSETALPSSHKDTKHSIKGPPPGSGVTLSRPICKDPIFK